VNERKFKRLKAQYEQTNKERSELLRQIEVAETDLKELAALMTKHEDEGNRQACEDLDNAYQQAYPDYTAMLQQLAALDQELAEMEPLLKAIEDYVRDTGFLPGLS
jgi:chromosome segregation ATPase